MTFVSRIYSRCWVCRHGNGTFFHKRWKIIIRLASNKTRWQLALRVIYDPLTRFWNKSRNKSVRHQSRIKSWSKAAWSKVERRSILVVRHDRKWKRRRVKRVLQVAIAFQARKVMLVTWCTLSIHTRHDDAITRLDTTEINHGPVMFDFFDAKEIAMFQCIEFNIFLCKILVVLEAFPVNLFHDAILAPFAWKIWRFECSALDKAIRTRDSAHRLSSSIVCRLITFICRLEDHAPVEDGSVCDLDHGCRHCGIHCLIWRLLVV